MLAAGCLLVATSGGCAATTWVHQLGRYDSIPIAERGVVLRDGRAVVDLFDVQHPVGGSGAPRVYVRRAWFSAAQVQEGVAPATPRAGEEADARADRVLALAQAAATREEPGAWRPFEEAGGTDGSYPPIPEQDPSGPCAGFPSRLGHFQAMSYGVAFLEYTDRACPPENFPACLPRFFVCDEQSGRQLARTYAERPAAHEVRRWWYWPSRVLFVPAVAADTVTFPVQAVLLLRDLREAGRDH
jgi:hypothetical protein